MKTEKIKERFIKRFGTSTEKIFCAVAPARVNLVGDHIDYNGGFVFPCAINLYLKVIIRKNKTQKLFYYADSLDKSFQFNIKDIKDFLYNKDLDFANYLNGALKFLCNHNFEVDTGFDVLIESNIPIASGLSSSAALEVAFILAVTKAFHVELSNIEIALLGKQIENEFLGLQSGIMDQFIVANAKAQTAMLLNTQSLDFEFVPFEISPYVLVVINSHKPRTLVSSKYNERRAECELAMFILQNHIDIDYLCELNEGDLPKVKKIIFESIEALPLDHKLKSSRYIEGDIYAEKIYKRIKHCVMENEFVKRATHALNKGDLIEFGKQLTFSHFSLKNDYEVSGIELDTLQELAISSDACIGARMTGAGFSGSAIAIVKEHMVDDFANHVKSGYEKKCNLSCEFYVCKAEEGVRFYEF